MKGGATRIIGSVDIGTATDKKLNSGVVSF